MASGGKVIIEILGDVTGFNSAISLVKKSSQLAVGAIAAMGSGIVALGAIGVNYNKQIETYTTNFGVMLGDTALAIEKVEQLKEMGARTPFELPELASATEQLLAFGIANEDTQGYLQQLGDISLGNVDKLNTLVNAFGKMNSTGKVTLETINMMSEQGFNPLQEISRTTGESMESLYDRVSAGAVSLDEITGAFETATSAGGQFNEGMAKASQTTAGLISTLKDNATALVGEVFMPISNSILDDVLPSAIDGIAELSEAFKEDGVEGLIEAGGDLLGGLITGITERIPDVANLAISLLTTLTQNLIDNSQTIAIAAGELLMALSNGIFTLLPMFAELALDLIINFAQYLMLNADSLIDGAVAMIMALSQLLIDNLPTLILVALQLVEALTTALAENALMFAEAGITLALALLDGLWQALPQILQALGQILGNMIYTIAQVGLTWVTAGGQLILNLWDGAVDIWDDFTDWVGEKIDDLLSLFSDIYSNFLDVGANIVDGIWDGIQSGWAALTSWVSDLASGLLDAAKSALGISSPSKAFRDQFGAEIAAGAELGIKAGTPDVQKALLGMADIETMQGAARSALPTIGAQPALRTAKEAAANTAMQQTSRNSQPINLTLQVGRREFGSISFDAVREEERRRGIPVTVTT